MPGLTRHRRFAPPYGGAAFQRYWHCLLFPVLLLLPHSSSAQLLDSIQLFMQEKPRIVVKLDTRGSFISNEPISMYGLKVGWEHAKRFQYGFGYTALLHRVQRTRQIYDVGELRTISTRLRLGYVSAYAEYAFYQRGHWEVRIPVQIGAGRGSVVYKDVHGDLQVWQRTWLFLYEPAMTVQYRFLTYFAVHAGFGYRLVFRTTASLGEQLTAPIYTAGLRVFTSDIWKDLKK
ncbi:MAG: hypothetical protein WAU70_16855 [Flavobacteriales bacterium]